jgi:hypothetical protein
MKLTKEEKIKILEKTLRMLQITDHDFTCICFKQIIVNIYDVDYGKINIIRDYSWFADYINNHGRRFEKNYIDLTAWGYDNGKAVHKTVKIKLLKDFIKEVKNS